jgi:hypothetical protein
MSIIEKYHFNLLLNMNNVHVLGVGYIIYANRSDILYRFVHCIQYTVCVIFKVYVSEPHGIPRVFF